MNESVRYGVLPSDALMTRDGLSVLKGIIAGEFPQAMISQTLGFRIVEAERERAVFAGTPQERHYNPFGSVHAGFAATMLDSAVFCSIVSTFEPGESGTTLELKMNLVRPILKDTGPVRAEGRLIYRGRTMATAEGHLRDEGGKLYAHATTTCMIFPAKR